MIRTITGFWVASAMAVCASDWHYGAFDNGSWFEAHVYHASGEMALHCGGRSPAGQPLPQTDEPRLTANYALDLTLAQPALGTGGFNSVTLPRTDIMVVSAAAGYTLPTSEYDELTGQGWITPIGFGDPLVRALMSGQPIAVDAAGQRLAVYDTSALPAVLGRMIAFCDARWYATGQPVPAVAEPIVNDVRRQGFDINPAETGDELHSLSAEQPKTPQQAQRTDNGLWRAVQTHILQGCNGAVAQYADGFARAANIDGDGVADYVILWDSIECAGQIRRPYCGASQCAVDVFASSIYAPGDFPKTVYAAALVNIYQGQSGLDVLEIAGRLAICHQAAVPSECIFVWGWVDGDLHRVN